METWVIILIVCIIVAVLFVVVLSIIHIKSKNVLTLGGDDIDEESFKVMLQNYKYITKRVDNIFDPNYIHIYIDAYIQNNPIEYNPLTKLNSQIQNELSIQTHILSDDIKIDDIANIALGYRSYKRKHLYITIFSKKDIIQISVDYIDGHIKYKFSNFLN